MSDLDAPNYFFCIFVHRMGRIAPIIRSDALLTLAFIFTGGHLCTVIHAETNNESDKIIINAVIITVDAAVNIISNTKKPPHLLMITTL